MIKLHKSLLSLAVACVVIISIFSVPASAMARPMPSDYDPEWYNPKGIKNIVKEEKEAKFTSQVNGKDISFYISFPSGGGVRLNTHKGFFAPEEQLPIEYSDENGAVKLTASNGMTALLKEDGENWTFTALNEKGKKAYELPSRYIGFGYQFGKIQKVQFMGDIDTGDAICGGGGRLNEVNQVGKKIRLWNKDGSVYTEFGYFNVPVFTSTKGYTFFFNSTTNGNGDIGFTDKSKYVFDFKTELFDLFIFTGTPRENIISYTNLTGKPVSAPKWALEYWAGAQANYWNSYGSDKYLDLFEETLQKYKELGTMPSAIYGEGAPSKDTAGYDITDKYGTRMLFWHYPDHYDDEMEGIAPEDDPIIKSYLNPYLKEADWCTDYSNPSSLKILENRYNKYWNAGKTGLKGLMVDYGEYVSEEGIFYNGKTGVEMHNLWSYYYCKAVHDAWIKHYPDKDFILFARSGCAGSQKYCGNFTGDQSSTWDGLKQQITVMLSASASGYNLIGGDIGGFFGKPSSSLYMRWMQLGAFTPLMRAHGTEIRDPWGYGEQAKINFVDQYWIRENILDMLYSANIRANREGIPMVEAMPMSFPECENARLCNTQYMFCDNFLVSPVTEDSRYFKDTVLPYGTWYSLWTGEKIVGKDKEIKAEAPQNRIPVYLKSGAVVPVCLGESLRMAEPFDKENPVHALIITPPTKKTSSHIYINDTAKAGFELKPQDDGSLKLINKDSEKKEAVLLYGLNADSVKLDGKKLKRIDSKSKDEGYFVDLSNRTAIRIPSGNWKEIEISGKEDVNIAANCLVYADNGKEYKQLTDGRNETILNINPKMGGITVDLGKVKRINQVTVKWGLGHAKMYALMGSADGENWEELYVQKKAEGGIEEIRLDSKEVRYLSITNMKRAAGPQMGIYSLEVNGSDIKVPAAGFMSREIASGFTYGMLFAVIGIAVVFLAAVITVTAIILKKHKKVKE